MPLIKGGLLAMGEAGQRSPRYPAFGVVHTPCTPSWLLSPLPPALPSTQHRCAHPSAPSMEQSAAPAWCPLWGQHGCHLAGMSTHPRPLGGGSWTGCPPLSLCPALAAEGAPGNTHICRGSQGSRHTRGPRARPRRRPRRGPAVLGTPRRRHAWGCTSILARPALAHPQTHPACPRSPACRHACEPHG